MYSAADGNTDKQDEIVEQLVESYNGNASKLYDSLFEILE